MAQIYKADGTRETYPDPANGTDYQLEELQAAIGGGYIEVVATRDGRLIVMDEEGKLKGFPLNAVATAIYIYGGADPIVGDVLVCDASQVI